MDNLRLLEGRWNCAAVCAPHRERTESFDLFLNPDHVRTISKDKSSESTLNAAVNMKDHLEEMRAHRKGLFEGGVRISTTGRVGRRERHFSHQVLQDTSRRIKTHECYQHDDRAPRRTTAD